jgi:hypothetical protein
MILAPASNPVSVAKIYSLNCNQRRNNVLVLLTMDLTAPIDSAETHQITPRNGDPALGSDSNVLDVF